MGVRPNGSNLRGADGRRAMKDYHINVFYSDDDGYIADIPDLQYCSAFGGDTRRSLTGGPKGQTGMAGGRACEWQTHPRATLSPSYVSSGVRDTPETAPEKQYAGASTLFFGTLSSWLLPGQGDVLSLNVVFSC